jgi:ABC-type phosphate/phosphonate transport system substrate-binding protein
MIAALPMYDRPATAAANDRFWAGIRDALRAAGQPAPDRLSRGGDLWALWRAPDLVLGQTCGLPYRARLHGRVTLVATPDYGLPGCPPGFYRSVLVVRADDPRADLAAFAGSRLAVNEALSQSGWAAPAAHVAARGLALRPIGPTGSHAASAAAVAADRADIAALDAVTWALLRREDDAAALRLRVLETTAPTPGLPLIAGPGADAATLRAACRAGLAALDAADRERLMLRDLVEIPAAVYLALPQPPAPWAEGTGTDS